MLAQSQSLQILLESIHASLASLKTQAAIIHTNITIIVF